MSIKTAIVLDGNIKSALAAIRSLADVGVEVMAGAESKWAMGLHSKAAKRTFVYPSPKVDQKVFIEKLIEVSKKCVTPPVLYAFSDATFLTLVKYQDTLQQYCRLVLPDQEFIDTAFDKAKVTDLAISLGIATIPELRVEEINKYPVVVKPRQSVSWSTGQGKFGTAEFIFNENDLRSVVDRFHKETGRPPLIQTLIVGSEYGVSQMCRHGEVLQSFVYNRVRSLSPRGGAATVKRTARVNDFTSKMLESAQALAKALNWTGPMMVEFKHETKTGETYLMEINGRFWGSLPLPQAAGVDFVGKYFELVTGDNLSVPSLPRSMITQHWLGDLKWLLLVLFKKDPLRSLLYPSRLSAISSFLVTTLTVKGDVWRWKDPIPFFYEIIHVMLRKS